MGLSELLEEEREIGREEGLKYSVWRMHETGMDTERIAQCIGEDLDVVRSWIEEMELS